MKLPETDLTLGKVKVHRTRFTKYNRALRKDRDTRFIEIAGWLTGVLKRTTDPVATRVKLRDASRILVEEAIYSPNIPINMVENMVANKLFRYSRDYGKRDMRESRRIAFMNKVRPELTTTGDNKFKALAQAA